MKIGIVVQRYGLDVVGGAEYLCRQLAERLAKHFEIEVLTTCAKDYITWRNEYSAGRSKINGVNVMRFPTIKERNLEEFNKFSDWIYNNEHSKDDELRWLEEQGPVCPELIKYINEESKNYDLMMFFTYLYYPTYYGMKECKTKMILIPTAHDEPAIRLNIYKEVMGLANAIVFNTQAEKNLIQNLFDIDSKIHLVSGIGIKMPLHLKKNAFKSKNGLDRDYVVFGGRIDAGKGCKDMIEYYQEYKSKYDDYPLLVMFGRLEIPLPSDTDIIYLGFISEQEKMEVYAGARLVIVPSAYESLSLVLLEGFSCGVPALVNASSPVLVDHCVRSNAGLYYMNKDEFIEMLYLLLHENQLRNALGKNGIRYIRNNYSWTKVINEYVSLINQLNK
jgi:glycosyltransferase involved in cell wall biosynthesis